MIDLDVSCALPPLADAVSLVVRCRWAGAYSPDQRLPAAVFKPSRHWAERSRRPNEKARRRSTWPRCGLTRERELSEAARDQDIKGRRFPKVA
jgi:hypothetical protein